MRLNIVSLTIRFANIYLKNILIYKQKCNQVNFQNLPKLYICSTLAIAWSLQKNDPKDALKELLTNADQLFENCHYEQCYNVLINSKDIKNVEIKWRLSRILYNMAKELKMSESKRKEMVLEAYDIVSEELQKHWDNYAVHKWYAILLDAKSTNEGIKQRIQQLENIKKHMDLAVNLNPSDATTLHMLGEWCYQIADMAWYKRKIAETLYSDPPKSSYEDALNYFLRAETAQPRFYSQNLLRIGNCYLKLGKDDQAKYYLLLAASFPAKSNEDYAVNKEAATLLEKIK